MIYKAATGSGFSDKEANLYGKAIEKIAKKRNGKILPKDLVHEARHNTESSLYDYFEWNNGRAATKYRIVQARNLLNHLRVIIEYKDESREEKAFFNVDIENGKKERVYVSIKVVANNEELREQIIKRALGEMLSWKERWKSYGEFAVVFGAIEETQKELNI